MRILLRNLNFAIPSERIASLNLAGEKKTSVGEELFEQEEKDKKDFDYAYEAYGKALYFMDKREYEKALPYFEIAIKANISSLKTRAYLQIGFCYGMLEAHTKEIEVYIQAICISPDDAITHYNLGIAYYELGFYEGAIEAFKQAIRIDPDYAKTHCNLGVAYLQIGDRNSALSEYRILKRLDVNLADKLFEFIY